MLALRRAVLNVEKESRGCLGLLLTLLGQENGLDVRQNSTLSDGDAREQLVQLFVVADGELEMTGDDASLLVVTGSVAGQLEDFSGQVLHNGSQVDGGTSTDTLSIVSLAEETMNSANGELESSTVGARLALPLDLTSLASTGHDEFELVGKTGENGVREGNKAKAMKKRILILQVCVYLVSVACLAPAFRLRAH